MRFVIKTPTRPVAVETLDWAIFEEKDSNICVLNIQGKLFEVDSESFEMLYNFYSNKMLNPMWTIVLDNKHVFVWNNLY